jgi:hypothetical protein
MSCAAAALRLRSKLSRSAAALRLRSKLSRSAGDRLLQRLITVHNEPRFDLFTHN